MNKKYIIIAVLILLAALWAVAFKMYYLDSVVPAPIEDTNTIVDQNPVDTTVDDLWSEIDNRTQQVEFSQDYLERPNIEINSWSNIDE